MAKISTGQVDTDPLWLDYSSSAATAAAAVATTATGTVVSAPAAADIADAATQAAPPSCWVDIIFSK